MTCEADAFLKKGQGLVKCVTVVANVTGPRVKRGPGTAVVDYVVGCGGSRVRQSGYKELFKAAAQKCDTDAGVNKTTDLPPSVLPLA